MRNFWIVLGSFVAAGILARYGFGIGFGGCVLVSIAVAVGVWAYLQLEAHRVIRTWAIVAASALVAITLAARLLANLPLVRQDLPGLATFVDAKASTAMLEQDRRRALEFHRVLDEAQRIATVEQHAGNTENLANLQKFSQELRAGNTEEALRVGGEIAALNGVIAQIRRMSNAVIEAQHEPVRGWLNAPRPDGIGAWCLGCIQVFLMFLVFPVAFAMLFGLPFVFAQRTRRAAGWLATVGAMLGMMYGLRATYWNEGRPARATVQIAVSAPFAGPKPVDVSWAAYLRCLEENEGDVAACETQRSAHNRVWLSEARDVVAHAQAMSGR